MTRAPRGAAGIACLLALAPLRSEAEDGPVPPAVPSTPSEDESTPSFSVTVRAQKRAKQAAEYVVRDDVLRAAPRTSATDVLRLVPGLVASQHSGEGKAHQLFLRGFDAMHGQDVEVLVGGIPVNQVSHIHALGYADTNFLIPEAVQELDVQEGSSRANQGDFAVAGTLRVKLGLGEPGMFLAGGLGQYGQQRLVVGVQSKESEDTFAAAELGRGDGFGPQRGFSRASLLAQTSTELAGGAKVRALAGAYAARFDSPGVVRADDVERGRTGFFDAPLTHQDGYTDRQQLLVELAWPHAGEGRTTTAVWGVRSSLRLRNDFTGFLGDPRGDGLEQRSDATTLGVSGVHQRRAKLGERAIALELGFGARHDDIAQGQQAYQQVDGAYYDSPRGFDGTVQQTDAWTWLEATTALGAWQLRLGGRVDALGVRAIANRSDIAAFGFHLGAKAGLSRDLSERWRLFLDYGDGFRSPQAASLQEGERAPFVSVHGGDVGLHFKADRVTGSASAFTSYVADDVFFDHTVGTTAYTGATLRSGLTLATTARPIEGLVLAASGTVAHALVLKDSSLLPGFAPVVLRGDGGYERPLRVAGRELRLVSGVGLTFVGPRPLRFGEYSASYGLVDARLGVRLGAVELRLDVKNLLDARWRDGEFEYPSNFDPSLDPSRASRLPARHFTAGAPRIAWLAAEIHL